MMTDQDHLEDRTYELLFGIRRSVRYHMHRRRFFEIWNTFTVAISMIGGSSAVVSLLSLSENSAYWWLPIAFSAFVAVVSALDFAVSTGQNANKHVDLARQFTMLEMEFSEGKNLNDDDFDRLRRERLRIEGTEPSPLRLLDVMCHYELLRSMGEEIPHPKVSLIRRIMMHFFSQALFARELGNRAVQS